MSLREILRERKLPTQVVSIPADTEAHSRLSREYEDALFALEEARTRGALDFAEFRFRVDTARTALDALASEPVTLRALPPAEWEALVELHTPSAEQQAAGARWSVSTFRPALLAASVVPGEGEVPLTEAEWEQVAKDGTLAMGELNTLFNTAVSLNLRGPAISTGKGY